MKLIQICPKSPIPTDDGGKIAMQEIANGLYEAGVRVNQLIFDTAKNPFPKETPTNYPFGVRMVFVNTQISVWAAFQNLFSSKSYQLSRFENPQILIELRNWLAEDPVDFIQAESIYAVAALIHHQKEIKIPIFIRAHNVEFLIWERLAKQTKNPIKRWYLNAMACRLKKEEIDLCNRVSGILAISEVDKATLQSNGVHAPVEVIGISTALKAEPNFLRLNLPIQDLFHLGAMDWAPNLEGIDWFVEKVWPQVFQRWPKMRLVLAGKNMPEEYSTKTETGIHTEVAKNAADFITNHGIMVVPLLSGSGIRVKLIEGLALGKVIIATSIAAEGIPVVHGKHILIADTPEEMMNQIGRCLTDNGLVSEISKNAAIFAQEQFSRERLTQKLLAFYHERNLH